MNNPLINYFNISLITLEREVCVCSSCKCNVPPTTKYSKYHCANTWDSHSLCSMLEMLLQKPGSCLQSLPWRSNKGDAYMLLTSAEQVVWGYITPLQLLLRKGSLYKVFVNPHTFGEIWAAI